MKMFQVVVPAVLVAIVAVGGARADVVVPPSIAPSIAPSTSPPTSPPLVVGVTLHPYFSWAARVAEGTSVKVNNILPGNVDASAYQPRPVDIAALSAVDLLVENGLGHDAFIDGMVKAAASKTLRRLSINDETPTLKGTHGDAVNSHTFLSFTTAIQQTNVLARSMAALRPADATAFDRNAASYTRRLRMMLAKAQAALSRSTSPLRVVTVHDGYSYLLAELGIELVGVVEPAHGLVPSARELSSMVALLQREHVGVVFAEEAFPPALLLPLRAAGARVFVISHVATGDYTAEKFEVEMEQNLATIVTALTATP
jgi:zinc transport system substrate-binding protein